MTIQTYCLGMEITNEDREILERLEEELWLGETRCDFDWMNERWYLEM